MRKKIEELLSSGITAYQIGKDLGMQPVIIQRYMNGERKLDNMTLRNAEKLYNYALEQEKNKKS